MVKEAERGQGRSDAEERGQGRHEAAERCRAGVRMESNDSRGEAVEPVRLGERSGCIYVMKT